MGSIYNIASWDDSGTATYPKNSIVKTSDGKFWYALQDLDANTSTEIPAVGSAYWNGYTNVTVGGTATAESYFFWTPSYNIQVSHTPRVKSIQFGDGYEQRIKDGINNDLLNIQLSFENRTQAEATAILHFLHSREGFGAFYFKVPAPYSMIKRFVCKEFNSNFIFDDNYSIQCKLGEVS
jgi:phage-related protein